MNKRRNTIDCIVEHYEGSLKEVCLNIHCQIMKKKTDLTFKQYRFKSTKKIFMMLHNEDSERNLIIQCMFLLLSLFNMFKPLHHGSLCPVVEIRNEKNYRARNIIESGGDKNYI